MRYPDERKQIGRSTGGGERQGSLAKHCQMYCLGLPGLTSDFVNDNLTTLLLVCSLEAQIGAAVDHGICVECLAAEMPSAIVQGVKN